MFECLCGNDNINVCQCYVKVAVGRDIIGLYFIDPKFTRYSSRSVIYATKLKTRTVEKTQELGNQLPLKFLWEKHMIFAQ